MPQKARNDQETTKYSFIKLRQTKEGVKLINLSIWLRPQFIPAGSSKLILTMSFW
jgi:hypothetical protein